QRAKKGTRQRFARPLLEQLEDRTLPSIIQWTGGSGDFGDKTHWLGGKVPGPSDKADILVGGINVTDSSSAGNLTIANLTPNANFVLSGDTLTVPGTLQEQNGGQFTLQGGTLAGATVVNSTLTGTTTTSTLTGVTLHNSTLDMQTNS